MLQTYNQQSIILSQKQSQQIRAYLREQLEAYYTRTEHIDPSKLFGC